MISKDYIITAPLGLHARPATSLIRLAKNYKSAISLKKGEKTIRLNSMLNILSLNVKGGETISVFIEGEDEQAASANIDQFFITELKNL
ncbi:HPr family phosphocarrier protein [Pedobacter miscanthi]|uniref:Phosphocarrier protein HPr n=1 Tax=Pedobacter miscanthi TaxID=2259170 RepID=A0A366KN99_9SPHI|nr:HPr family phosphocarrier protein [Pedobacter miscanthi]RBQ03105.1 HPr family phosphocarrier protein [Pedobacter miscanthi]